MTDELGGRATQDLFMIALFPLESGFAATKDVDPGAMRASGGLGVQERDVEYA
jgi:hypothetical protein